MVELGVVGEEGGEASGACVREQKIKPSTADNLEYLTSQAMGGFFNAQPAKDEINVPIALSDFRDNAQDTFSLYLIPPPPSPTFTRERIGSWVIS